MKELLRHYGLSSKPAPLVLQPTSVESPPVRTLQAAERQSSQFFNVITVTDPKQIYSPSPRKGRRTVQELKQFSESPLPSRAIMLTRDMIASLDYEIRTKNKEVDHDPAMVDIVKSVLDNPNTFDDDLQTFLGQVVEDIQVWDSACWEYVEKPENVPGNQYLELAVVPAYTIQANPKWRGEKDVFRWRQDVPGFNKTIDFLDSQLEMMVHRKRSWSIFGHSPIETAAELIDAWLGLSSYQREVASNAYPAFAFYLGSEISQDSPNYALFRTYWEQECLGRGRPPIFGGFGPNQPASIQLKSTDDAGLYLQYQEMLVRTLALCFGIKPMDMGLERDVNRNTAEVSQSASIREAVKPIAQLISRKFNQRVIPRIAQVANEPAILDYEFVWTNIDPTDENARASILGKYLLFDVYTIDEVRSELGMAALPNQMGEMTPTAFKEFVKMTPESLMNVEVNKTNQMLEQQKLKLLKE